MDDISAGKTALIEPKADVEELNVGNTAGLPNEPPPPPVPPADVVIFVE
jgi:hypothetical protein